MDSLNSTNSKDQTPINIKDYPSNFNQSDAMDNIEDDPVPPLSKWRYLCNFPLFWKIKGDQRIRIHYSEEELYPYYFCHTLFSLIFYYYFDTLFQYVESQQITLILTILFILTNVCFIVTHFSNPGILPYHWAKTRQRKYTSDEIKSGIATTSDQINYGKTHNWPARAFFSGHYGAIILRCDHNCFWLRHWIGLKNLRYFTQSLLYCSLFYFVYLYTIILAFRNPNSGSFYYFSLKFGLCFFGLNFFGVTHVINLYGTFRRIAFNYTTIEQLLEVDLTFYDKGLLKNFEEVFGSIYLFPLWFLPVPLPLPVDGFGYMPRPDDICNSENEKPVPKTIESND